MTYSGTILTDSGAPIPGSAVVFKDSSGGIIATIPVDNQGYWSLNSETDSGLFENGITAFFTGPGWGYYSIDSSLLPETFYVTLKKQKIAPWIIAAIVAAVALILLRKGKKVGKIGVDDVKTVVYIIGGLLGIAAVTKILKMVGLLTDPRDKELDTEAANPLSPWNPNFWNNGDPNAPRPMDEARALTVANTIYSEIGTFWDNEDKVISAIHSLRSRAEVSFVSWKFTQAWDRDLLTWLRDGPGSMPWHGLSTSQVTSLNNFVYQLPKY